MGKKTRNIKTNKGEEKKGGKNVIFWSRDVIKRGGPPERETTQVVKVNSILHRNGSPMKMVFNLKKKKKKRRPGFS